MSFQGRRAVVTGGGRGLGAATAAALAAQGATGVVLDLPAVLADATPPAGWSAREVDVTDEASVASAMAAAAEGLGGIDVLVAAAGIVPPWASTAELDLDVLDAAHAVNVRGVAAAVKHAAPHLGPDAAVVVIGSLNSWRGDPNIAPYVASKHAVLGLVRAFALDLGARGVRVNAVAPGPVATEALLGRVAEREQRFGTQASKALGTMAAGTALGRIATQEEVAAAILFLASDAASAITGHLLPVDGGIA